MPSKKKSSKKLNSAEDIKELASKKDVTIFLDEDGITDEAKMGSPWSYSRKNKILTIVSKNWDPKDRSILLEIIKKAFKSGGLIWKSTKEEILESYIRYYKESPDQNILRFFSDILPIDDYTALKLALYLRDEQKKGKNISNYKKDIRDRFGERGANIANLCTAGYFESEFLPLYNSISKEAFLEYYEITVGKKARALFVHRGINEDQLGIEFEVMLQKATKYHMEGFRIHGIGTQNVSTIKNFFNNRVNSPEDNFIVKREYEKVDPPAVEYEVIIQTPLPINNGD